MDPHPLINAYLDSMLDEDETRAFVAWLHEDQDNVRRLVSAANLHSALRDSLIAEASEQDAPRARRARSTRRAAHRSRVVFAPLLATAAGVMVIFTLSFLLMGRSGQPRQTRARAQAQHGQREVTPNPTGRATRHPPAVSAQQQRTEPESAIPPALRPGTAGPEIQNPDLASVPKENAPPLGESTDLHDPTVPPVPDRPSPAPHVPQRIEATAQKAIARITYVDRQVRYVRGTQGKWANAVHGIQLLPGDGIETRGGLLRLDLEGGTVVLVNRSTLFHIYLAKVGTNEAILLDLDRGEIYVADAGSRKVIVETADGMFTPVGTRFDVKRSRSATLVVVEQGVVRARAKAKKSADRTGRTTDSTVRDPSRRNWTEEGQDVRVGHVARIRCGLRTFTPRKTDVPRAVAWT